MITLSLAYALTSPKLSLPKLERIRVSPDGHYFVKGNNSPFFWLADTGWTMTTRLTGEEIEAYLSDRKHKGFNVIQVVLVPWDARWVGNLKGDRPYVNDDMAQPNPKYFDHVDDVLERIKRHGLYPAVVPFWLAGLPEPTETDAIKYAAYASYLGKRFGQREMFWLLGADRWPGGWEEVIRMFARKLLLSSGRSDLVLTHHPAGGQSSSRFFHSDDWLGFNMLQSGHNTNSAAYRLIEADFLRHPTKPVLDGEPAYENITQGLVQYQPEVRLVRDSDVRRQAYQSVFSGAAGHTYGACEVYEFHRPDMQKARWTMGIPWQQALKLPGSAQMGYLKRLIESHSPGTRVPDNNVIVSKNSPDPLSHCAALRDQRGGWILVYSPKADPVKLDLSSLKGSKVRVRWFNPASGVYSGVTRIDWTTSMSFSPPPDVVSGDYVLELRR